ncbi:DUF1702 family protein [Nocardiopsis rhodophaea]|uniref:DUF1702 family protein n=2 Tax=Nocardiopsis rhodophaea TaxID=280238 RepID=A0ABN2SFH5_9ACTN
MLRRPLRPLTPLFVRSPERLERAVAPFPLGPASRERVRAIVRTFIRGYNTVVRADHPWHARAALEATDAYHRPFAYEGACMGFGAWAVMALRGHAAFEPLMVRGLNPATVYQNYVGFGWWLGMWHGRRPATLARIADRLDHRYRLLVYEGIGFQRGFTGVGAPHRTAVFAVHPSAARHVCYQGYGRSLWFVHMDRLDGAHATIARLPAAYRGDCYSGLGLGCAFSRLDRVRLVAETARAVPAPYRPDFLQGAAFGWEARYRADPALFTELTADAGHALRDRITASLRAVHQVRDDLTAHRPPPPDFYQAWRAATRQVLLHTAPTVPETTPTDHPPHRIGRQR